MIRVRERLEPAEFEALVRVPGRRWLTDHPTASGSEAEPHWRDALPLLRREYKDICAYFCCWVGPATGAGSTDHFVAKKTGREHIYEWRNYRFACGRMNGRKGVDDVPDPFEVQDGSFVIDFRLGPFVVPAPELVDPLRDQIEQAIDRSLKLNSAECLKERGDYLLAYRSGAVIFRFLIERAPFLALELCRQGLLHPADSHYTTEAIRAWLDS